MEENTNKKSEAALREEKVLAFWNEKNIFKKSLDKKSPKGEFVFYDGPVTANSKPVLHTMEPFAFKDAIPRYKTMRGYHVRRKGGWDTHGLPVELQIEKKLGFKSKKEIEDYGIAAFNKLCKDSVWEYIELWKNFTKRVGYWADQDNAYVTYHNTFIESLWNVVKVINEQKLLYKDYKVVPWCPRCGTALSSHELAQGYQDDKDLSVTAKFKVKGQDNTYILAWTTTPWTLPGNVALAVGKDIDYVKIKVGEEILILAKERLAVVEGEYKIVGEVKGKDLVGLEYEALYPYLSKIISEQSLTEKPKLEKAFKVYEANFVTTTDGTGVVHTAVMYGQDDFELGTQIGLPKYHLVGLDGKFLPGTGPFEGRFVKDEEVAVDVIKDLAHRGLLFKKEKYEHSYPHCWRCKTALIYYARDSWYIRMSDKKVKDKMISENKEINWEPAYTRDGRFGEWLREIKDWAISRERYWGTPLPVWACDACKKVEVVGSMTDLKQKTKTSGNKYFVMRHGGTEGNKKDIVSFKGEASDHLLESSKEQVEKTAKKLSSEKIDLIISSPFARTKETADIIKETLGLKDEQVILDNRLGELNPGDFDGGDWNKYHQYVLGVGHGWFEHRIPNGESLKDVSIRTGEVLYELENKYKDKNILIVTHGGPAWLLYVNAGFYLPENEPYQTPDVDIFVDNFKKFKNGEARELDFIPLPHNENYELDLHRPYIDEVKLACECGGNLIRTKEVMDVWFDSGSMPFAQDHYPFEPGENKKQEILYPADYICEAIDQTRGWFYTLHAVGVLMGRGKAYKNVICLGHLLDASGKKMSKSIGNIVDPWEAMQKFGVDSLRLWMYSVNQPGESKNFDEKTVALLSQQVFGLLYNVLAFYELYKDLTPAPLLAKERGNTSSNILDEWILARLNELIKLSTESMDNYKLLEPVRAIKEFIGDLSTWYLRRSRDRIKDGDKDARETLYFVLKTLAKLLAPFAPFAADDIWIKLKTESDTESVHLVEWPEQQVLGSSVEVLEKMEEVRKIVSLGLEARQKAKIAVRQKLNSLIANDTKLTEQDVAFVGLIQEELNVNKVFLGHSINEQSAKMIKKVTIDKNVSVKLDEEITPELKAEGEYREFMRELQDRRKKLGLNPGDKMDMSISDIYKKYKIMPSLARHMLRVAGVASIICDNLNESVDKNEIVVACLLHDMGNIIKSKLDYFPEFLEPEGLAYWQKVKYDYMEKYGKDEHNATLQIMKEIGVSDNVISLANENRFSLLCKHSNIDDIRNKIIHYADARVGPHSVLSYEERMEDANKRYKNHELSVEEVERNKLIACGKDMEQQIFAKCKIKPEDINNESVKDIVSSLRDFVIHS